MPPSLNEMHFTGKAIAKTVFDLNISDTKPTTASKESKPRNHFYLGVSQPLTTDELKGLKKVTFLTLPAELRLQIYNQLLVSRFDRTQNPWCAVGNTNQKVVPLHMNQAPQYRTMEPGILQTCKQIHREGNSILYSQNVFDISEPKQMFQLIAQIGLVNLQLIRTLHIWVPWTAELPPWLQLLSILAKKASGLRCVELGWGTDTEFYGRLEWGAGQTGLGDNLDFVRALGKIQGLEKLVITGYYAKKWPADLEKSMDVHVLAIRGECFEEAELREEELNDEESEWAKFMRDFNEDQLKAFGKYQQGTENLIP